MKLKYFEQVYGEFEYKKLLKKNNFIVGGCVRDYISSAYKGNKILPKDIDIWTITDCPSRNYLGIPVHFVKTDKSKRSSKIDVVLDIIEEIDFTINQCVIFLYKREAYIMIGKSTLVDILSNKLVLASYDNLNYGHRIDKAFKRIYHLYKKGYKLSFLEWFRAVKYMLLYFLLPEQTPKRAEKFYSKGEWYKY